MGMMHDAACSLFDSEERCEEKRNGTANSELKKSRKMDRQRAPSPQPSCVFRSLSPVGTFPHYLNAWAKARLCDMGLHLHKPGANPRAPSYGGWHKIRANSVHGHHVWAYFQIISWTLQEGGHWVALNTGTPQKEKHTTSW